MLIKTLECENFKPRGPPQQKAVWMCLADIKR